MPVEKKIISYVNCKNFAVYIHLILMEEILIHKNPQIQQVLDTTKVQNNLTI